MLFDLESDPIEKNDIASEFPDIVVDLLKDVEEEKKKRPKHPRYWMRSPNWTEGFLPGTSISSYFKKYCVEFCLKNIFEKIL